MPLLALVNLKRYGVRVRELYALTFDYWSLPISVEYPDDQDQVALVRIGYGVPLLQVQREAAEKVLDSLGHRKTPTKWVITSGNLAAHAQPAAGNPENVVDWRPGKNRLKINTESAMDGVGEDFFTEFVKQGWVKDVSVAKVLWRGFCLHALHWMVNRRQSVDMLFCEITPLPFRPNWKTFVQNEELKLQKKKSIRPSWMERAVQAMTSSAAHAFKDPRILWFNAKERYIYWTLDVKPTTLWYKMVAAREAARKHRLGSRYFVSIVKDINKIIPKACKIYAAFLREISKPGFEYRSFAGFDRKDKPLKDTVFGDTVAPPEINYTPVAVTPGSGKERPGTLFSPTEETSFVLGVSRIQPPVQDVRDSARQVGNR